MQYFDGFIWWKHFFPGKKFNQIQKVRKEGEEGDEENERERKGKRMKLEKQREGNTKTHGNTGSQAEERRGRGEKTYENL